MRCNYRKNEESNSLLIIYPFCDAKFEELNYKKISNARLCWLCYQCNKILGFFKLKYLEIIFKNSLFWLVNLIYNEKT